MDFLYAAGIKFFHNFTARVIGIGMNDPMWRFAFNPRNDPGISRARFGIDTLQHIAEAAAANGGTPDPDQRCKSLSRRKGPWFHRRSMFSRVQRPRSKNIGWAGHRN